MRIHHAIACATFLTAPLRAQPEDTTPAMVDEAPPAEDADDPDAEDPVPQAILDPSPAIAVPLTVPAPPPPPPPPPAFDVHGGLNLRTDLGVHPLRLDGGVRYGAFDAVLVLDPMFWTDGQSSTDLLLQWRSDVGVAGIAGWRMTGVGLAGGTQLQQNLLLGLGMDLPTFCDGAIRGQWGLELAMMLVKHGADLPPEVISFESGRHYIDLVNFAMFARFEFAWAP